MLHYRKNVNGAWEICSLSAEEATALQEKITNMSLSRVVDILKKVEAHNKKPDAFKIELGDATLAAILNKVVPSYESLANDLIEINIKKKLAAKLAQS